MALITSYATLQSEALDFMERAGQSGKAPTWIQLAEAKLSRELGPLEGDTTLTGVVGSRSLDISALSIVEPISLWLTPVAGADEIPLQPQSPNDLPFAAGQGEPTMWAYDSEDAIKLDRPCDQAYSFRFRYRGPLSLATTDPNWLLTNHPDVYLAATLMWGAGYNESWENGAIWKGILDEAIPSIKRVLSKGRRGTLRVDATLMSLGHRGGYNITTDR